MAVGQDDITESMVHFRGGVDVLFLAFLLSRVHLSRSMSCHWSSPLPLTTHWKDIVSGVNDNSLRLSIMLCSIVGLSGIVDTIFNRMRDNKSSLIKKRCVWPSKTGLDPSIKRQVVDDHSKCTREKAAR